MSWMWRPQLRATNWHLLVDLSNESAFIIHTDNPCCCLFLFPCSLSPRQRPGLLEARHAGTQLQDQRGESDMSAGVRLWEFKKKMRSRGDLCTLYEVHFQTSCQDAVYSQTVTGLWLIVPPLLLLLLLLNSWNVSGLMEHDIRFMV